MALEAQPLRLLSKINVQRSLRKSMEYHAFFLIFLLAILGFPAIRGLLFYKKLIKIELGMNYDQVISILGLPKNFDTSGDITTCVYCMRVMRDFRLSRIVVFRNDTVISILKGD